MKRLILIACLIAPLTASAWLFPTNPPAAVTLGWNASTSPGVSNYFIYYGVGSMQFTNKVASGNTNACTITNLVRGTTYWFAATAQAGGLESDFSNEISYTPPTAPAPPSGLKATNAIIAMKIESAPTPTGPWTTYAVLATSSDTPAFFRSLVTISAPEAPVVVKPLFRSPKKQGA